MNTVACLVVVAVSAITQPDAADVQLAEAYGKHIEAVRKDPNDSAALQKFADFAIREVNLKLLVAEDPLAARKTFRVFESAILLLVPTSESTIKELATIKNRFLSLSTSIENASKSLADLERELASDPDNSEKYQAWHVRQDREIYEMANRDPEKARELLQHAQDFATTTAKATSSERLRKRLNAYAKTSPRLKEPVLESGKALVGLVGKKLPPLPYHVWINGEPKVEDLKGKVILLDFARASEADTYGRITKVRNWHEQFGKRGLVVITVVNTHYCRWDDAEHRFRSVTRREDAVQPDERPAAVKKFAEHHNLQHAVVVPVAEDGSNEILIQFTYAAVVVDQTSTIRMIRAETLTDREGAEISGLLAELLPPAKD
jgi:hypothetical protein